MKIGVDIFYGKNDLKNYTYTLHLPNISFEDKKKFLLRVQKHGGVNIIIIKIDDNFG
jgi:hypothetical protein